MVAFTRQLATMLSPVYRYAGCAHHSPCTDAQSLRLSVSYRCRSANHGWWQFRKNYWLNTLMRLVLFILRLSAPRGIIRNTGYGACAPRRLHSSLRPNSEQSPRCHGLSGHHHDRYVCRRHVHDDGGRLQLTDLYKDFGIELPTPTKILISLSTFFVHFWWLMIAVMVGLSIALRQMEENADWRGKLMVDSITLKLPLFGDLTKKGYFG